MSSTESSNSHEEEVEMIDLTRQDMLRAYNRVWYHMHKTNEQCEHCGKTFVNRSSLTRHQRRNLKCNLIRVRKELLQEQQQE